MTTSLDRANGPPTDKELARLLAFISRKEEETRDATSNVLKEQQSINVCEDAVNNLDMCIQDATDGILTPSPPKVKRTFLEEGDSKALGNEMAAFIASLAASGMPRPKEGMDIVDDQIRHLRSKLSVLQEERNGWDFSLRLSQYELRNLQTREKGLLQALESAKAAIAPVRKVPDEVWARILSFRVEGDLENYLANAIAAIYKPAVLTLSYVCRQWRRITETEPSLWRIIPVYAINQWPMDKKQLLERMVQGIDGVPEFMVNAAYDSAKWFHYNNHPRRYGFTNYNLTPVDASAMSGKAYSLTIIHLANGSTSYSTISNIPFRQPQSLTLRVQSAGYHNYDMNPLAYFTGISKLTLVGLQMFQTYQIGNLLPNLKYLSLDLTTFNAFDLQPHLPANLEELYLRHHGLNASRFSLSGEVQLVSLATLGVTPYELELFKDAQVPALRRLILYSPQGHANISLDDPLVHTALFCKKLQSLELHDWTKRESSAGSTTGWSANSIFSGILQYTPKLKAVTLFKCFIDVDLFIQSLSANAERSKELMITLDRCSGITRQECEAIIGGDIISVQRFSVLV